MTNSESGLGLSDEQAVEPGTAIVVGVVDRDSSSLNVISGSLPAAQARVVVRGDGRIENYLVLSAPADNSLTAQDIVSDALVQSSPVGPRPWEKASRHSGPNDYPRASVVMCTVGTNPLLPSAVEAVLSQSHDDFEFIVVDNAPQTGAVATALREVDDKRLRIVPQPARGLSHARNAGVEAARGDVIAFTDDDAFVDGHWLANILAVFAADNVAQPTVGAVTGPAFPAELKEDAQRYFEARGGFPKTLVPTVWSLNGKAADFGQPGEGGPLYPVTTARVGAGVSMAFRREALEKMGPFDTALGAGTRTNGGEDLDAFARILRAGYAIVTTPDAVVHHVHRRDLEGLRKQTYGDGTGMAALLTKSVTHRPSSLLTLARRVPAVLRRVAPGSERVKGSEPGVPPELTRAEIIGFLRGPLLYAWAVASNKAQR